MSAYKHGPIDNPERIQACLNCKHPSCINCFGSIPLGFPPNKADPLPAKKLVDGYNQGLTIERLAEICGISAATLLRRLRNVGVPTGRKNRPRISVAALRAASTEYPDYFNFEEVMA